MGGERGQKEGEGEEREGGGFQGERQLWTSEDNIEI